MSQWNDPQGRQPESWEVQPTQYLPPGQQQPYPQQQQPYAQQQYGYPQGQPPRLNPFGAQSNEAFGIAGTVCALLGFVVLVVAFTALDWFKGGISFGDVHDSVTADNANATGFATAYFGWLAWTFAIVAVLAAVGSCFPSPAVRALRITGVVIGIAAAGLSFLALNVSDAASYSDWIKNARAGFYLAVGGYLLAAVGAAIGTRRV